MMNGAMEPSGHDGRGCRQGESSRRLASLTMPLWQSVPPLLGASRLDSTLLHACMQA